MQDIICELQDMKHLDWAARKMSPGTPGCFLKAYEEVNGKRLYYKYRNKIWEMNIGEILRVNGMRSYDEHKLLLKNEGRSCQDEFYIEHM